MMIFYPTTCWLFLNEQNHLISEEMGWWYFTQQYVGSLLINKCIPITFHVALNGMTTKKVTTTKCWSLVLMLTFNTYTQKNTTRSWLKSINKITAFLTITNKMRFDLMLMYISDHSCEHNINCYIIFRRKPLLVRKNMNVNEHERLSNIALRLKLK